MRNRDINAFSVPPSKGNRFPSAWHHGHDSHQEGVLIPTILGADTPAALTTSRGSRPNEMEYTLSMYRSNRYVLVLLHYKA